MDGNIVKGFERSGSCYTEKVRRLGMARGEKSCVGKELERVYMGVTKLGICLKVKNEKVIKQTGFRSLCKAADCS